MQAGDGDDARCAHGTPLGEAHRLAAQEGLRYPTAR
jgi:hypothetical protein